jgi:hypothetical protein
MPVATGIPVSCAVNLGDGADADTNRTRDLFRGSPGRQRSPGRLAARP